MSAASMLPWLTSPVMLHSDRVISCSLTPEQCSFILGWWVSWYEGDHHYALPTVGFFLVAIVLFALAHIISFVIPRGWKQTRTWSRFAASIRILSYKRLSIRGYNTMSIGSLLLAAAGAVYFLCEYYPKNLSEHSSSLLCLANF